MKKTTERNCEMVIGALSVAAALLLGGCATEQVVLDPVGPPPAGVTAALQTGYLKVYTTTEERKDGEDTYHPHSGYDIYTASEKLWRFVPNRIDLMDESPMVVEIPAGDYKVLGRADGYGRVTVPVVIESGKLTEVNLEGWPRKRTPVTNTATVVQLPNGYVVGWRAKQPKEIEVK